MTVFLDVPPRGASSRRDFGGPGGMKFEMQTSGRRWAMGALLLLMAGGLGGWLWWGGLRDRWVPKRWGVVEAGAIYRSGRLPPALLREMIGQYRLRRIVDLTLPEDDAADQRAEKSVAAELGVEYRNYPLYGWGGGAVWNYAHALAVMAAAKREGQPVLVHCSAGAQRTGGVIAAYRMLIAKWPPAEAYAEMVRYGWEPAEDRRLQNFLNENMRELAARLLEMGLIDAIPEPLPVLE